MSNMLGAKVPLFCGHKLTYNCNLRCKMCPFWKRPSPDPSLPQTKAVLKQIYNSGAVGVAFEGGEPLLRRDLVDILAFSRSLPLHTSLITNGTLLKSRIDEIAPYINGVVYVSLDGLEKTHDAIRGIDGSFRKALGGINAAKEKVPVTINMTVMAENVDEIESLVELAKKLGTKISIAVAHEYCNTNASSPANGRVPKIAHRLIEMKREGYPIVNSIGYLKVIANEKNWQCKPWTMINIDPNGKVVLPCYVHNNYASSTSIFEGGIKAAVSGYDWKKIENCRKCSLHCYVEPSLVLSRDISAYMHWAFHVSI
ncbi:MAG: PTO1314 family radical SAM protein [Candidatus Bathyarchaeota archaeon]|nr:PTO1314 family radical SAM protein [Candidatus Bathyarchaeota archaeon]